MDSPYTTWNASFTVDNGCDNRVKGDRCTQRWNLKFLSEKICDKITSYNMDWYGEQVYGEYAGTTGSLVYTINIAQASICGIMVDDAPLNGELVFTTDDTYTEVRHSPMYPVGTNVYLRMTLEGLSPISNTTLLSMRFVFRGVEHRIGGSMFDKDWNLDLGLNPGVPVETVVNPIFDRNVMKWYLYLHEDRLVDVTSADQISIIVRVEVTYEQFPGRRYLHEFESRGFEFEEPVHSPEFLMAIAERGIQPVDFWATARRRLQEGIGEEFDTSFTTIPASCEGKLLVEQGYPEFAQFVTVQAGTWAEIRCHKGGSIYVECTVQGWNLKTVRDQCLVPTELVITTTRAAEPEGLPWWYAVVLVLLALCCCCCGLCLCGRKPQEVQNKKYIDARKNRKTNGKNRKRKKSKKSISTVRGSKAEPKSPTATSGEENPDCISEEDQQLYE